ncbi:MAG: hypothetical protein ABIM99_02480 [Candidatus Dojkabacteria bacterium]
MDRKLLTKRIEIVLAVLLIVVVVLGVVFLLFRSIPVSNPITSTSENELLPGIPADPNEFIKFLDLSSQTEFTALGKKIILPTDAQVNSAYNNTSLTQFSCRSDISTDCTIYEIDTAGRRFYISAPLVLNLKSRTSTASIKKKLVVAGEEVEFTYMQKKFFNAVANADGVITETIENKELTTVEEIYGCLSYKICFSTGRLEALDKTANDLDVTAFETFVQSIVIQ